MTQGDVPLSVEEIFDRFCNMPVMSHKEQQPERDLILMIVLGMRILVQRETEQVEQLRRRDFRTLVKGLAIRNTMDQWNDALCLLMAGIDRYTGSFTIDDPQHVLMSRLRNECEQTMTVINKSRPSFHQPITE
jgi:hypothetical protein